MSDNLEFRHVFSIPGQAPKGFYKFVNSKNEETDPIEHFQEGPLNIHYAEPSTKPPVTGGQHGEGWPQAMNGEAIKTGDIAFEKGTYSTGGDIGELVFEDWIFDGEHSDNFGFRLLDCTGKIDFINCTFKNCRQGVSISGEGIVDVRFFNCKFIDNWHPGNTGLPAEVAIYHSCKGGSAKLGFYGCLFSRSGYDGTTQGRQNDASQYDHHIYTRNKVDMELIDCISIHPAAQHAKAIGVRGHFIRNVFLGGAIGVGIGADEGEQNNTGERFADGLVKDCLFYGLNDVPVSNQKLGWAVVTQSSNVRIENTLAYKYMGENSNAPFIRTNKVDNYPDAKIIIDKCRVSGYGRFIETSGANFQPDVTADRPTHVDSGIEIQKNRKGSDADPIQTNLIEGHDGFNFPELDIDNIDTRARNNDITASEILASIGLI